MYRIVIIDLTGRVFPKIFKMRVIRALDNRNKNANLTGVGVKMID